MINIILNTLGFAILMLTLTPTGVNAEASEGQKIFEKQKCTQCHSIEALKIGKVEGEEEEEEEADEGKKVDPPDLSGVGKERDADWISQFIMKKSRNEGRKHKKKFKGGEAELKTIAEWLTTLKSDVSNKKSK